MALHEQSVGASSEWYTPAYVFKAFGCRFDTDTASPGQHVTPWIPADKFITPDIDSLLTSWGGFRFNWINPRSASAMGSYGG